VNRFLAICLMLVCICGCVSTQKLIEPTTKPESNQGYIAAAFSGDGVGNAFGLVDVATGEEYLFPFFGPDYSITVKKIPEKIQMIQVPPGTYDMKYWITYDTIFKQITTKKELTDKLRRSLKVKPGKPVFIGRYLANYNSSFVAGYNTYNFRVHALPFDRASIAALLEKSYPYFSLDDFEMLEDIPNDIKRAQDYNPAPDNISPKIDSAIKNGAAETKLARTGIDLSGTYVSEITSNSQWVFREGYTKLEVKIAQNSNGDLLLSTRPKIELTANLKGDVVTFSTGARTEGCRCTFVDGKWQIKSDGTRLIDSWKRSGGSIGTWNLTKIE